MSEHSIGVLVGIMFGLLVGALVCAILLKITKTDGKMRCKYDERQNLARGRGFKYGFFTALLGNLIYGICSSAIPEIPVEPGVGMVLIALLSALVYIGYCIWNDAYFSLNENRPKLLLVFAVIGVLNLILGISNIISGDAFSDGVLNIRSINLFCGLMFLIIFIMLLLRRGDCE